jgi:uncharacterized membrane protein
MSIITVIVVLVVAGVVFYLVENYIPMSPPFKIVVRVVIILVLCLWLLSAFGVINTGVRL